MPRLVTRRTPSARGTPRLVTRRTSWGPRPRPGGLWPSGCRRRSPARRRSSSSARCGVIHGESESRSARSLPASTARGSAGSGRCCTRSTTPSTWSSCSTSGTARTSTACDDGCDRHSGLTRPSPAPTEGSRTSSSQRRARWTRTEVLSIREVGLVATFTPARLADGSLVRVVAVGPQDRARLRVELIEGFARLSPESRFSRFLTAMPRLTSEQLRRLVDTVDDRDHVALGLELAESGTPIGLGRFVRYFVVPTSADVAVTVADEWQGKGAGTILIRALAAAAKKRGVRHFTALVLADNLASLAMLRAVGRVTRCEHGGGAADMTVELSPTGGQCRWAWARMPSLSSIPTGERVGGMRMAGLGLCGSTRKRRWC